MNNIYQGVLFATNLSDNTPRKTPQCDPTCPPHSLPHSPLLLWICEVKEAISNLTSLKESFSFQPQILVRSHMPLRLGANKDLSERIWLLCSTWEFAEHTALQNNGSPGVVYLALIRNCTLINTHNTYTAAPDINNKSCHEALYNMSLNIKIPL